MLRTDLDIQNDVTEEIAFDPSVNVADIDVTVKQGKAMLSGAADTYATKYEAEDAAYGVCPVAAPARRRCAKATASLVHLRPQRR